MSQLLCDLYFNPDIAEQLTLPEWTRVITYGRDQNMLGRLWYRLQKFNQHIHVPEPAKVHFLNEVKYAEQQKINVDRELNDIATSFEKRNIPCTILKGAAYSALESECHLGRIYNDIDLLVDKERIRDAEIALMTLGFFHRKETDYDKRYFREWMHEIQPMVHNRRLTTIDLHHNILPLTNKKHFNATKLESEQLAELSLQVLTPVDRFIHSATHLFTEGEFAHPVRDITDLYLLFNEIDAEDALQCVTERAAHLGLSDYTNLALYFILSLSKDQRCSSWLKMAVKSSFIRRWFVLPAYEKVFRVDDSQENSSAFQLGLFILYVRSHVIKMPMHILIPHLIKKAIYNFKERFKEEPPIELNK